MPVSYTHLDVYKRQDYRKPWRDFCHRHTGQQLHDLSLIHIYRQRCYRVLSDYYYLLKKWEADRSPRTPEEEAHPRFVEAIQKKDYVEYLLDLFLYESEEEQDVYKRQIVERHYIGNVPMNTLFQRRAEEEIRKTSESYLAAG